MISRHLHAWSSSPMHISQLRERALRSIVQEGSANSEAEDCKRSCTCRPPDAAAVFLTRQYVDVPLERVLDGVLLDYLQGRLIAPRGTDISHSLAVVDGEGIWRRW